MMKRAVAVLMTIALIGMLVPAANAQEAVDIQNNPYFIALLQIGLQKEQVPRFKELLGDYANDRQMAIESELRRREPNIELRVRRAKAQITADYLVEMGELLDDEQYSRYPPFQAELDKMLLERESLEQANDAQAIFPDQT